MHDHEHDTDTYYLDQLCMIGLTGAFAGICLTLYFFNTGMLRVLLQDQFHPMLLAAGITLLCVAIVRAAIIWRAAGGKSTAHEHHQHDHEHCDHEHHDHEHEHHHHHHEKCGHEHDQHAHAGHSHGEHGDPPCPAVATAPHPTHVQSQSHGHSHGPDDGHDHGWAPWRYVVLLVPVMLYLLGLPSKALPLSDAGKTDLTKETGNIASIVGLGSSPLAQSALAALATADAPPIFLDGNWVSLEALTPSTKVALKYVVDEQVVGKLGAGEIRAWIDKPPVSAEPGWAYGVVKVINPTEKTLTVAVTEGAVVKDQTFDLEAPITMSFKDLEQLAYYPDKRKKYAGSKVLVTGQFAPHPNSDRMFNLARLRIQCCGADAIQLNVPIISRESLKGYKRDDWVRVTGRIEFREQPGRPGVFMTVLVVNRRENVVPTVPDPRPYIN